MADKRIPANPYVGAARAALGQGLGLGWGDEAEAWLRAKAGEGSYDANVRRIRDEYARYAQEHPFQSGALEFGGGALPSVAAMLVPGGQGLGAMTGARALAKLAAIGGASGAVAGAGAANEGDRGAGAVSGGVLGTVVGGAAPVAMRGANAGIRAMAERYLPSEARVTERAAGKINKALSETGAQPADIMTTMRADRAMKVPSVVANVSPATANLAEAVAQRTGSGGRLVEQRLTEQRLGAKERTYGQIAKALKPGDYYDDAQKLAQSMRTKAAPLYEAAYARGTVEDPEVLKFLELPQFKAGLNSARELLAAEGRKLPTVKVLDPVSGEEVEKFVPTVEALDQVKRGLDALIEKETDAVTGKTSSLGRVYTQKKNEFLAALDTAVPEYGQARAVYRGDAELMDAMNQGIRDFGRMDHEQVAKAVSKMSDAEKQAFRTGVARDLYSKIMDPSGNFNAAQRIIGSPETQAKLQPLFENPAQYDLFKAALEREAQLFGQSNKILGGSQTGKRLQMREELDSQDGAAQAIGQALSGGFWNSLTNLAGRAILATQMPEKTAARMAEMLMSKDPAEVAAVVKLLEQQAAGAAPKAARATAAEAGAVGGTAAAIPPAPTPAAPQQNIEDGAPVTAPAAQDLHELMLSD